MFADKTDTLEVKLVQIFFAERLLLGISSVILYIACHVEFWITRSCLVHVRR